MPHWTPRTYQEGHYRIYPPESGGPGRLEWAVAEHDSWIKALFVSHEAVRSWFGHMLEAEKEFKRLNEGREFADILLDMRGKK